jgi:hypothetical protein
VYKGLYQRWRGIEGDITLDLEDLFLWRNLAKKLGYLDKMRQTSGELWNLAYPKNLDKDLKNLDNSEH